MPKKGYKQTEEHKRQRSRAMLGKNTGKKRTEEQKEKIKGIRRSIKTEFKKGAFGPEAAHWKGGKYIDPQGYILVYDKSHPNRNKRNYILEHRLVMEKHLRRLLKPEEVVHHKNGNVSDNRLNNLMLFCDFHTHFEYHKGNL